MTRLVFDTNVCGKIASSQNKVAIMKRLRSQYKIEASANTLFELLLGFCRSPNGEYFVVDQERLKIAIGYGTISSAKFLDHGLVFALRYGPKVLVKETGMGEKMFRDYTRLVLKASGLQQLRATGVRWQGSKGRFLRCDVIEADFVNAKQFYQTDVYSPLPDRVTWATNLGLMVRAKLTGVQAGSFADSLDGLYAYEQWLRKAVKSTFKPEKNENDQMDMHQLFYLADPSLEFITEEEKIRTRIAVSQQSKRVVLLKELLQREQLAL